MTLKFHVEIEVNQYGEANVPYIKNLLATRIMHVGDPKVYYEGSNDLNKWAEEVELEAIERGEL